MHPSSPLRFVGTSAELGATLYFMSQFDSSLEEYLDEFVLIVAEDPR